MIHLSHVDNKNMICLMGLGVFLEANETDVQYYLEYPVKQMKFSFS